MSAYLVRTVETYRVDTEKEAEKLINDSKTDSRFTLTKNSSEIRQVKQKGEVVDEWVRVILTKDFNIEKDPETPVKVEYELGGFPEPVNREEGLF